MALRSNEPIEVLTRKQQQKRFGIDCGDAILYGGGTWSPGGEHVKKILVKNVSNKTIKFKYTLPQTKFFSMEFPELTTLSPGNSKVVNISFRPTLYESYDDFVLFTVFTVEQGVKTRGGKFKLSVKANIAILQASAPTEIDFKFCPTNEVTQHTFELKNTGQINGTFSWIVPDAGSEHGHPFTVQPSSGALAAGEAVAIVASFTPSTATVFESPAMCIFRETGDTNQQQELSVKIMGIGKYTFISTPDSDISFGDMLVGAQSTERRPLEKTFVVNNPSLVRASYQVVPVERDHPEVFFFSPIRGVIDSRGSVSIKVRYSPISSGDFSCDHFDIKTPGGNTLRITCRGRAVGPVVSIWKKNLSSNLVPGNSINFQDIEVGKTNTRVLILKNTSQTTASFHFICPQDGVFTLDKVQGNIAPMLETGITMSFTPTNTGNFYRRVYCLVHNQSPLYVDILGTGYNSKARPSPFQQAHVNAYRSRARVGLGLESATDLEEYMNKHGDALFLAGAIREAKAVVPAKSTEDVIRLPPLTSRGAGGASSLTRSGEALQQDVDISHEFFIDSCDENRAIIVKESKLDFGSCSIVSMSEKKLISVVNRTKGKVTCVWRSSNMTVAAGDTSAFDVFPSSQDISPGATVEFKVAFHPTQDNSYYFSELEAHVYFKSNRTFRLVNEQCFTPPWCIVTYAYGNTFGGGNTQFLPKVEYKLPENRVVFPSCHLGDSVFQTFMMNNLGDTPSIFCFENDPAGVFTLKPVCGIIPASSFQLVQVRFTPKKTISYKTKLRCSLNSSYSNTSEIQLVGTGCLPKLSFDSTNVTRHKVLAIKPTAVGLTSTRVFQLQNDNRIPLIFRWKLPPMLQNVINISPNLGRLNGNDTVPISISFSPKVVASENIRLPLEVKAISGCRDVTTMVTAAAAISQSTQLKLRTRGITGVISFSPSSLDFSTILVNSSTSQKLTILNASDCDLQYSFDVVVGSDITLDKEAVNLYTGRQTPRPHTAPDFQSFLSFSKPSALIPARSRKTVVVTFCPSASGQFNFKLNCKVQMVNEKGEPIYQNKLLDAPMPVRDDGDNNTSPALVCNVNGGASFPTLEVQDIYAYGVPTTRMWAQIDVPVLNEYLGSPLTRKELKINQESSPDFDSLPKFDITFTPSTIGSNKEVIAVQLHNPGALSVDFSIRFPNEREIEIDQWADEGEPSVEELRQNIIIDSKIFDVQPRSGVLSSGESLTLELTYDHISDQYDGIHVLPVILQVSKGKQFVLQLSGRTLNQLEPILFIPNSTIDLSPVGIGDLNPPVQRTELLNLGDSALQYVIECEEPCKALAEANYGINILECSAPQGIIGPRSSVNVEWVFNPLEAKTYRADFKVLYQGLNQQQYAESQDITISGDGYHPDQSTLADERKDRILVGPPSVQHYSPSSQTGSISTSRLDFGHLPTGSATDSIVIIRSNQTEKVMAFRWDECHPMVANGTVAFHPITGRIAPGEHAVVKVTLRCGESNAPVVVNDDIECQFYVVVKSDDNNTRKRQVPSSRQISTVDSRLSVETRQTRSSISFFGGSLSDLSSGGSSSLRQGSNHSSRASARKASRRASRLAQQHDDSLFNAAAPSALDSVFIHVFAQFISPKCFRDLYGQDAIDKHVQFAESFRPVKAKSLTTTGVANAPARSLVSDVMSELMQEVVANSQVEEAISNLPKVAPTPFFSQFKSQPSSEVKPISTLEALAGTSEQQKMTATILENTIYNLVQEISFGEFNPTAKPKRFVIDPAKSSSATRTE